MEERTFNALTYLSKSICELDALIEILENLGITCDEDNAKILKKGFKVEKLQKDLMLDKKIHGKDIKASRIVRYILEDMVKLKNACDELESVGLLVEPTFANGNYYKALGSLSKSLCYFCGIDLNDEEEIEKIDVMLSEYNSRFYTVHEAQTTLLSKYENNVNEIISDIKNNLL